MARIDRIRNQKSEFTVDSNRALPEIWGNVTGLVNRPKAFIVNRKCNRLTFTYRFFASHAPFVVVRIEKLGVFVFVFRIKVQRHNDTIYSSIEYFTLSLRSQMFF